MRTSHNKKNANTHLRFHFLEFQNAEKDWTLSYLRTKDDMEVDLIIDRPGLPRAFIEFKSTTHIENENFNGLKGLLKTQRKAKLLS